MMGMFSTLEYMVDASMEDILEEIPVSNDIKTALISGEGEAGKLLQLVICYEQAEWKKCQKLAEELGIQTAQLSQLYINCVEEVSMIWEGLTGEYQRPGEDNPFKLEKEQREKLEDVLQ